MHMENTEISPGKTAAEIQAVLGAFGCSAVMIDYDKGLRCHTREQRTANTTG